MIQLKINNWYNEMEWKEIFFYAQTIQRNQFLK